MDSLFSQKTLEFLFEKPPARQPDLVCRTQKEYQSLVIQPMRQLVMDLSPTMLELDPQFITEPKVDKTIARIWRDTRYTQGSLPCTGTICG